jgi:hypothetical protein
MSDSVAVALVVVGAGMFFIGALAPTLSEFKIGISGFSAKLREREQEVQTALDPDAERLAQTATWLTGSPEAGRKLLEQALVDVYLHWPPARGAGPSDAVRKRLVDLAPPVAEISQAPPSPAPSGQPRATEVLAGAAGLPADERSALVLRLVEGLGANAVGAITDREPAAVEAALEQGAQALVSTLGLASEGAQT